MTTTMPRKLGAVTAAVLLALAPDLASAQEPQVAPPACTAELTPSEVQSGAAAVLVTAKLSESIGAVASIEAQGASGIKVAAQSDVPRTEMAREGEAPQPIQMAADNSTWTLYLNTTSAQPGEHQFTLEGILGDCAANVTVR